MVLVIVAGPGVAVEGLSAHGHMEATDHLPPSSGTHHQFQQIFFLSHTFRITFNFRVSPSLNE